LWIKRDGWADHRRGWNWEGEGRGWAHGWVGKDLGERGGSEVGD
jgi:hypothetical protein